MLKLTCVVALVLAGCASDVAASTLALGENNAVMVVYRDQTCAQAAFGAIERLPSAKAYLIVRVQHDKPGAPGRQATFVGFGNLMYLRARGNPGQEDLVVGEHALAPESYREAWFAADGTDRLGRNVPNNLGSERASRADITLITYPFNQEDYDSRTDAAQLLTFADCTLVL